MRRLWRDSAKTRCRWSCISKTCRIKVAVTITCGWEVKSSVSSFARILQDIARNRQEHKNKWEIQKDNDFFDISRDSCSNVFSWVFKASLWSISAGISSRRSFNPCFASSYAASIEASDVQILEAELNLGEAVSELLKLDSKKVELQLKDDELEMSTKTRNAINDLKQVGKQKQCYLRIRSFFTSVTTYMQKSLALRKLLIEALACLQPDQKTGIRSIQKLRECVKPEELTLLTDEWRVYAEKDIPQEWVQRKMEHLSELINTGIKFCSWRLPLGSQKFSVLAKTVKCALGLSHGNADNEGSLSVNKKTLSKERSGLSIVTLNGLGAIDDGIRNVNGLSNIPVT